MGDGNEKSYGFSLIHETHVGKQISGRGPASGRLILMPSTSATATGTRPEAKCRIAELVQYTCESEKDALGNSQFHCWPIPRVFRM